MSLYEMSYYPTPNIHGRNRAKFELDLDNYATKSGLKEATDINTSELARKFNLVGLKQSLDKLHI